MWFQNRSLKFWLLSTLSVAFLVFYLFIMALIYYEADHEVNEIYDAQLIGALARIEALVKATGSAKFDERKSTLFANELELTNYYTPISVAILNAQNREVFVSDPQFKEVVRVHSALLMQHNKRLLTLTEADSSWRVFVVFQAAPISAWLVAGEPMDYRKVAVWEIMEKMGLPVLIGFPLLLLLFSLIINAGFRQLNRFSETFTNQSPQKVIQSRVETDCPLELRPLVLEIQQLLARAQKKTEQEKQFTANAAHELKTPIAALRLQIDLLDKTLKEAGTEHQSLDQIKNTIRRTENLIQKLLNLQKLEVAETCFEPVSLSEVLLEVHQLLIPLLDNKQQQISYQLPENEVRVSADVFWCKQLLINLLSNAIFYSPQGGKIEVRVTQASSRVQLEIEDSGEGLTEAEIERVTERFYRLDKHKGSPNGCGLGLSIVKEICSKYQIDFQMGQSDRLGGLKVILRFHMKPSLDSSE